MRYAQYVRNYKYTYIPEACGDNTGIRVGYPPTQIVANIIPPTHSKGILYDMSYSVFLKWVKPCFTGCTPIISYTIQSIPGGLTALITPQNPKPIVNGLQFGVTYAFEVITTNIMGDSKPSKPSNAILQYSYPDSPNHIQGVFGDLQINLLWDEPFNGGSPISYYNIYINYLSPFKVTNRTSLLTNLILGNTYNVELTAVNSYGESYPRKYTFIGSTYPDNPANITFIIKPVITVSWNVPIKDGYSPVDFYRVSYTDRNGVKLFQDVSSNVYTTTIDKLTLGQPYIFNILAHNPIGFTQNPTIFNITPCNIPQSPSIIKRTSNIYTLDGLGLVIEWDPPVYNGGGVILSYSILYVMDGIESKISIPSSLNSYSIYDLTRDMSYFVTMTATNASGESPPSNSVKFIF